MTTALRNIFFSIRYSSSITSKIWLDNLDSCNSLSRDLRKCTKAVGVNDCTHSEDIILTCYLGNDKDSGTNYWNGFL